MKGFFSRSGALDPAALRDLALFRGLDDLELAKVAKVATRREVAAGTMLIEQGRIGLESFAIAEGVANVYFNGEYVTSVAAGQMIGEMAILGHRPRNATVVAETDLVVACFASDDLRRAFDESPELEARITNVLQRRLDENAG